MSLIGLSGAILVKIAHGFLAALCFALSGWPWDQKKTLEMEQYGGLLRQALCRRFAGDGHDGRLRAAGFRRLPVKSPSSLVPGTPCPAWSSARPGVPW